MKIRVIHNAFGDIFKPVAEFEFPEGTDRDAALEECYRYTNHITDNWIDVMNGESVHDALPDTFKAKALASKERTRSTSVDDLMIVDGTMHRVASCGFEIASGDREVIWYEEEEGEEVRKFGTLIEMIRKFDPTMEAFLSVAAES